MPHRLKRYDKAFDFDIDQLSIDDCLEALRDKGILKYRTKFTKSGDFLEIAVYPLWKTAKTDTEKAIPKPSRAAQKNLNHKNRARAITRQLHANFTTSDIWGTLGYDDAHLPADENQAQRDMQNFIRRLRAYAKKHGLPDVKYIYVTECRADNGEIARVHHHIVTNFPDRDVLESIWHKGSRSQTRRLAPDDFGLEGLAHYISKEKNDTPERKYSKRYNCSKNLDKPIVEHRENVIRKRRAERIALDPDSAKAIFEDLAKHAPKGIKGKYGFTDMEVKYSQYVSGVYLYVRMREKPQPKRRR